MTTVTLLGKPGCHLCDEARLAVEEVRSRIPFELQEVDVSLDAELHRRYGERIPVVEIDGEAVCELGVDPARLHRLLAGGRSDGE